MRTPRGSLKSIDPRIILSLRYASQSSYSFKRLQNISYIFHFNRHSHANSHFISHFAFSVYAWIIDLRYLLSSNPAKVRPTFWISLIWKSRHRTSTKCFVAHFIINYFTLASKEGGKLSSKSKTKFLLRSCQLRFWLLVHPNKIMVTNWSGKVRETRELLVLRL